MSGIAYITLPFAGVIQTSVEFEGERPSDEELIEKAIQRPLRLIPEEVVDGNYQRAQGIEIERWGMYRRIVQGWD